MKTERLSTIARLMVVGAVAAASLSAVAANLPPKDKFKIVVLAGQSNMAGRGKIDPDNNKPHPRVLMLNKDGNWVPCVDPVHFDANGSGVGPGKAFGEALADSDPSITVGLVPCAVGGTSIAVWEPGKEFQKGKTKWHPYDDMVERVTRAKKDGVLTAILWHQGESDCMRRNGYLYQIRFPVFVERMRLDIGAEGIPFIVGGLHTKMCAGWFGNILARTHKDTCEKLYGPGKYIPGKEWELEADKMHYTGAAQREFAQLYFAAYKDVAALLAKDPGYYKKAAENLPAIPDNCGIPKEQMESVPATLPEKVEKYVFPKGASKPDRKSADRSVLKAADGWKDPVAAWKVGASPVLKTAAREKVSLNGFWAFGVDNDGASIERAPAASSLKYYFKVPGSWPNGGKHSKNGYGVWDAQGRDHFGADVESINGAWYARTVEIPSAWNGRRILLSFDAIPSAVLVYVDGKKAGEAFFPSGEVDLTSLLGVGRHEIALYTSAKLPEKVITAFDAPDTARSYTKKSIENRGIFGDVALAAEPKGVRITDVQARPSVSKKRIDFSVGLSDVSAQPPALKAVAVVEKGGKEVKRFESAGVKPDANGRFVFGGAWADPMIWDFDVPENLYTLRVSLVAGGKTVDELYPETFGFREIRIEGRNLLVNGTPVHLRPRNSVYGAEAAVSYADCREAMRRHRAFGFNAIVFHKFIYGYSEGDTAMLDMAVRAASEEGLACILSMPHPNRFDDPKNPHHWTYGPAYERIVRHLVRRFQNVPGVLLWSSTHNQTGYESDQNPMLITGRPEDVPTGIVNWRQRFRKLALKANEIVGSIDPTRPLYHHESGAEGTFYTLNCYLDWAPIQERSDWFEHWEKNGVMPLVIVEWGLPHQASWSSYRGGPKGVNIWSARDWTQQCWMNEYDCAFLGEDAFRSSPGKNLLMERHQLKIQGNRPAYYGGNFNAVLMDEPDYHAVLTAYASRNLRDMRARGVTSILPWDIEYEFFTNNPAIPSGVRLRQDAFSDGIRGFGAVNSDYTFGLFDQADDLPRGIALATREAWRDQIAWIAGPVGDFTSVSDTYRKGEKVKKSLVILNDTRRTRTVEWVWKAGASGTKGTVKVAPGGRADVPVEFVVPRDAVGDTLAIRAAFRNSGGPEWTAKDSFELKLLPAAPVAVKNMSPLSQEIFLFDPEGTAAPLFDALGVKYRKQGDAKTVGLVVVGRRALTKLPADLADAVRSGRVPALVLEQDTATLRSLGFRVQEHGLRNLFAFDPFLAGLDLTDWRGRATLLSESLNEDPNKAAFPRWDWDGHNNTRVWRAGNRGMVSGVLPEKPAIGDFRALVHGGFDLQYAPVLVYRKLGARVIFSQLDLCGRTERSPEAEEALAALIRIASGPVTAVAPRKVKVLEGKDGKAATLLRELRIPFETANSPADAQGGILVVGPGANVGSLESAVKGGVNVLALGLSADEANKVLPSIGAKKCGRHEYPALNEGLNAPAFIGVSNADIQWIYPNTLEKVARFGKDVLVTRQIGNGHVVFCSIAPWIFDEKEISCRHHRRRAQALATRLLCNLGASPDDGFLARLGQAKKGGQDATLYVDKSRADDDPYRYYRW